MKQKQYKQIKVDAIKVIMFETLNKLLFGVSRLSNCSMMRGKVLKDCKKYLIRDCLN